MASNDLNDFIKELAADPELSQSFSNAANKGIDEAYEFALKHSQGYFEKEEFENYMMGLAEECANLASNKLEDNSLANIAGGAGSVNVSDLPSTELQEKAALLQAQYDTEREKKENQIRWLKKSSSFAKLATTITNIGFSIFKAREDAKNEDDHSDQIKIAELQEQLKIKDLENKLKKYGIDDYEALLDG